MKTINDYAELVKEKHALNKTIAPVETDLTDASRGYHIGEQFIYDGELNKAKTEIAQHDALVLNTNYEPADNLTEQIKNAGGGTGTDPRLDVFENNIAPVETDETDASRAYQVGEQLILDNILYDVIAPISEHDVITTTGSGANIEPADPISSQIQTLTNNVDVLFETGVKNICPPYLGSYSANGITYIGNSDGTVTVNGTCSANVGANVRVYLKAGQYKVSGCPSGGSYSTYRIGVTTDSWTLIGTHDHGNGTTITIPSDDYYRINLDVRAGYVANNLVFKPMITDVDTPESDYDHYVPYAKTNHQLTQDSVTWDNLSEVGAVNMLPNTATTQTINGVTFTVNSDGTVTANGTATANAALKISDRFTLADYIGRKYVDAKKNEASSSTYSLIITYRDGSGAYVNETYVPTEGFILSTISNATLVEFGVFVKSGQSVSNLTFKPMITVSSYNGDYVPYAKSNKELAEDSVDWESNSVLGAKNFLTNKGTATTQGVEFAVDSNGVFTVTRKSAGSSHAYYSNGRFTLKPGTYIFSNGYNSLPSGIQATYLYNHTDGVYFTNCNNGPKTFTITEEKELAFNIEVQSSQSPNGVKIYPMIRLASDNDATYQPYAMTNRELTEKINEEFLQNTASISAQINYKDVYLFTTNGGSSSGSAQYSSAYLVFGQATTQITYFALKEGTEITPSVDGTTFTLTASTSITMAYRKL